jgi:predicted ATP-dependent serine protease
MSASIKRRRTKAVSGSVRSRTDAFLAELKSVSGSGYPGMKTDLAGVDEALGGLRGFMILGGLPGHMKSSLAVAFALRVVEHNDAAVLYVSSEMRANRVMRMICSAVTGLSRTLLDRDCLSQSKHASDREIYEKFVEKSGDRLFIHENSDGLGLDAIREKVEQVREETDAERILLVVDSIHDLAARQPTSSHWSEKGRIDSVMSAIGDMVEDGKIAAIGIAHLPKAKPVRDGDVFQFLGTAGIDYIADVTAILEREKARKGSKPRKSDDGGTLYEKLHLHICKNRFGEPGNSIPLKACPATCRFEAPGE